MDVFRHAGEVLRARDRDRYLADLFAPEPARSRLFALHAFDTEMARVGTAVTERLAGEIRLQWWRDVIEGRAEAGGNPLAEALLQTIGAARLPRTAFLALIEARIFDLYDDALPTLSDLEGYLGETVSAIFQLGAIILANGGDPGAAELSGHAGVVVGLAGILAALPAHAGRGQNFLPRDVLRRHGVDLRDGDRLQPGRGLNAAAAELRSVARRHLGTALAMLPGVPKAVLPAFLPLVLVEQQLAAGERQTDPLAPRRGLPGWRRQWLLWRGARRLGR